MTEVTEQVGPPSRSNSADTDTERTVPDQSTPDVDTEQYEHLRTKKHEREGSVRATASPSSR